MPKHARRSGLTMIEAMVVLAILGILLAVATPGMRSFIGTMNSKSVAFDLVADLALARAEAIKRNRSVVVGAIGGDWSNGWTIRVTGDANALRARDALGSALTVSNGSITSVTFRANGRLSDDTIDTNLKWTIKSSIADVTTRCVVITPTGSARSAHGAC